METRLFHQIKMPVRCTLPIRQPVKTFRFKGRSRRLRSSQTIGRRDPKKLKAHALQAGPLHELPLL
jgi:hypothetical protein